jgi:hypothetical protein
MDKQDAVKEILQKLDQHKLDAMSDINKILDNCQLEIIGDAHWFKLCGTDGCQISIDNKRVEGDHLEAMVQKAWEVVELVGSEQHKRVTQGY